jgi:RNA polymerase sigma-70 factor, ECF subfamily
VTEESRRLPPLSAEVRTSWQRFLDTFEPLRPALYRYCRHLTHDAWDAEDLVQETLSRAFVTLGTVFSNFPEPRAWLFRVASNTWIDQVRRSRLERLQAAANVDDGAPQLQDPRANREAAATLLALLSPQQRAAVVLKDVFDFSLDEIASMLETTPNAVKGALHRGRERLDDPPQQTALAPAPGVLDAFARAFNARDLPGLAALLLETSSVEIVGLVTEYGLDAPQDPDTGSFAGSLGPLTVDERGGVAAELLEGDLGAPPRCEVVAYRDRWLLLLWFEDVRGPVVRGVMTLEAEGAHIRRLRNYFFSPQVIAEVCSELGLPHRLNGYRYWHPL